MHVQYVEARRIHTPWVLNNNDVRSVGRKTLSLAELERQYRRDDPTARGELWRSIPPIDRGNLQFSDWLPRFGATASCEVVSTADPGDTFGQERALLITFNADAITTIGATLREQLSDAVPAELKHWQLRGLQLRCLPNSPVADVLSLFDVPADSFNPADFERCNNILSDLIDRLWPIFFAILNQPGLHAPIIAQPATAIAESWDNEHWAFGQPAEFRASQHPDFDPSEELQYDAYLVLSGCGPEVVADVLTKLRVKFTAFPMPDGSTIHVSDWAVAVFHEPGTEALEPRVLFDKALRTVLVGLIAKYETYNERVYAAILNELVADRLNLSAQTVRRLVYRTEQLRLRLYQRTRRLAEHDQQLYQHWSESCSIPEIRGRVDRLGDLVVKGAEGVESANEQAFERRVQVVGLFFVFVAVAGFLLDMWLFTHGDRQDTPDYTLGDRLWIALSVTFLTAGVFWLITVFSARRKR